jgi:endonuclease III
MVAAAEAATTESSGSSLPVVAQLGSSKRSADPFRILIATLISARTKDLVTAAATTRLFELAAEPASMARLGIAQLERAIFPAGFYHTKARHIRSAARLLLDEYDGEVPADRESLMRLPGVGRKTANLVLGTAFGIPAICVDTHVHRISNRVAWVATSTPAATEAALELAARQSLWIRINAALVSFGQQVCKPTSPQCVRCPFSGECARIGV